MKDNEQEENYLSVEEKKLLKKYIEEYNDLYQKILILSFSDFLENIKKRVEIVIKSKIKNYSHNSITNVENYLKENIYLPDYKFATIIKKNILNRTKRELALHYFRGEIIPHCSEDKKDDYYIHICGERFQFFRYKSNNIKNYHGIHYDYILYCIKCNMIYKSSLIKFKCNNNDSEFYSKLLINNDESSKSNKNINNKCFATWKKYHCNAIINDTMKCDICEESYLFFQESNLLYCPKCKNKKNPLDIVWKCIICQKEFKAEAKIYNPFEYKSLKICVKEAVVNKIKAKPEYMVCKCDIDIDNTKFFHKSVCKGELYLGEINSQKVVVCGKCDTLGLYEGYIWTCPNCMKRFKTKKREGSVCTKLGLVESSEQNKDSTSKRNRYLSEKNCKKYSDIENNINDIKNINNYMNDNNNNTISSPDNDILNYLKDIKESMNINKVNFNKENPETINFNKEISKNSKYNKLYSNSFIQTNNFNARNTIDNKINNLSFSEKSISNNLTNNSFNSKIGNTIISNSNHKFIFPKEKVKDNEDYSNDSKFKSPRYIINNYKKKNNFFIKNIHLKTENKEKEKKIDFHSNNKKNIPYSLFNKTNTNTNINKEKTQSESKEKNIKMDEEILPNDENNFNTRKLSSYRKPYYSINNSFIKTKNKDNIQINDNRKSEVIVKYNKNNIFKLYENEIENEIGNKDNEDKDKDKENADEDINLKDNNTKVTLTSMIEDTKKKYKKKNKIKKYLYNSKDNKKIKDDNRIIAKALNFQEMNIKDENKKKLNYFGYQNNNINNNSNNSKITKSIKLRKNNNININININNSANNLNENDENMNDINNQKRIFSNSIIMNNLTLNDKDNILNSINIAQNKNIKKSKTILGNKDKNNINSINHINTNININNINNNLQYYNQIHNNINYFNNNSQNKNNRNNLPKSYKKKINNKNAELHINDNERKSKNIKNNNNAIINNNINKNISNRNSQKFLLNQKYSNFTEYKIIKQIGKGTFGQIFMVENNQHQYFALKKLIATNLKDIKTLEHEYQILLDIQSHGKKINLVQIYGIETKQLDPTTFVMYVLMELATTDWEKEILVRHNLNKYYSENQLMNIISSLITTFAQLQKENISHRDIKPQNILIFQDSKTYKLADFGEAKELLGDDKPTERQTLRGTELYMSPILFYALRSRQIIKYVKHNPYKSDLFSFGLCCLFASTLCFESIYDVRELRNNTAIKYIIQKYLGKRYSKVVINIICSMLDVNENSRNDFIEMEKEIKKIGY